MADAVDLGGLAGAEGFGGVEAPRAGEDALAAEDFVASCDATGGADRVMPRHGATVCPSSPGYAWPCGTHGECIGLTLIQVGTEIGGRSVATVLFG